MGLISRVAVSVPIRRFREWARRTFRLRGATIAEANRPRPGRTPEFRLFAVLGTWMEADVVEACVKNALTQGCEEVFFVDNDSPDDTVDVAQRAGATLAASFATPVFNDWMRIGMMNEVVEEVSRRSGDSHIWWLWLDADEFPHGPRGLTVRDLLSSLDGRFRVVGAQFFTHVPSAVPAYIPGAHPLDHMPWCAQNADDRCGNGMQHFKHPLQRFDRGGPPIEVGLGFHSVRSRRSALLEPKDSLLVHHFQSREEATTRARMAKLCGTDAGPDSRVGYYDFRQRAAEAGLPLGMVQRFAQLDEIYANARAGPSSFPPTVRRWTDLVGPDDAHVLRWY
jgi:Glycosyl transferase family 2